MRVITAEEYLKKKKKGENIFDDDIAPVRSQNGVIDIRDLVTMSGMDIKDFSKNVNAIDELHQKQKDQRKWFDTGAFEDGFDLMDIPKTIGGTALNVGANLLKGSAMAGEGLTKLVAGGVAQVSDWVGNEELAENIRGKLAGENEAYNKFMEKYGVSSNFNKMSNALDGVSITGEKTDDLTASIGQLLAGASTGNIGANAIMFGSSAGHELENAYKSGATNGEAWGSALITGASEVLFEKLSGGIKFGGTTLDEIIPIHALTDKIANKTAQTLTKFGIDAVGEGFEEVLTEVTSNVGKKLTYEDEQTWKEILASDEALDSYLEAFIGGAVMGGGFNVGKAHQSIKTGRNYDTGLTTNEQLVLDKEIEARIKEASKDNKKLSNKEINKIKEEAKLDLQKGNISTGTIESTLGGETYKNLQKQKSEVESIKKEIKELKSKKMSEMSVGEYNDSTAKIQALQERIGKIDTKTLESQLNKELEQLTGSDDYLQRSYHEKAQRGVNFQADLSKYDAKQQEIIKKAIDSGILNNTTKTHEFVDMVAKLSADKGVSFDFTNNEKLKGSSFAVEGKTVNGFVTKDGITVNIDSNKALNSVVGHEITHVLEGTELYTELQQAVKNYSMTKGDYNKRLEALQETYKNVKDANIENELTADLVGDYLFTDTDFVRQLSVEKPNLFQKIYNEIKYLVKIATAGSKEARQLEKVKKAFEDAYRQTGQQTGQQTDTKSSVSKELTEKETYAVNKWAGAGSYIINDSLRNGYDLPESNGVNYKEVVSDLNSALAKQEVYEGTVHRSLDLEGQDLTNFLNKYQEGKIVTEEQFISASNDGIYDDTMNVQLTIESKTARDTTKLMREGENEVMFPTGSKFKVLEVDSTDKNNIKIHLEDVSNADVEYSLTDNQSRELSKEQQDFFKDSKVRDKDGSLTTVYHTMTDAGTQFNEFNPVGTPNYRFGDQVVNYFTDSKEMSSSYADERHKMADTKKTTSMAEAEEFIKTSTDGQLKIKKQGNEYQLVGSESDVKAYEEAKAIYDNLNFNDKDMLYSMLNLSGTRTANATEKTEYFFDLIKKYQESNLGFDNVDANLSEGAKEYFVGMIGHNYKIPKAVYETYSNETQLLRNIRADVNYLVNRKQKLQYEGYANITNPYVIDADGENWNNVSQEYSKEIADRFTSLTAEERTVLTKVANNHGRLGMEPILGNSIEAVKTGEGFSAYGVKYTSEDAQLLAGAYTKLMEGSGAKPKYDSIYSVAEQNFKKMWIESASVVQLTTNDIVKRTIEENKNGANYDGVIIKNVIDYGGNTEEFTPANVYVTFNSNQFKAVDNLNPTDDADIRYSLSDNQGRELSEGQREYFKDSKVRDENGSLMAVYHGTTEQINTFEKNRLGSNTGAMSAGEGFFFTSSKAVAEQYSMYARPTYIKELEAKQEQLKKIAERERTNEAWNNYYRAYEEYEEAELDYGYGGRKDYENTKEVYLNITNPLIHDFEGGAYRDVSYYELLKEAKENGNDGAIFLNTYDGYGEHDSWGNPMTNIYVAFESEQIKNVDNTNPTSNPDTRYSLSEVGLKQLAEKTGESFSSLEANLSYENEYGIKRYLTKHTDIVKKYMEDNNISVEPVYKEMEFAQLKTDEQKQFVIDNDLDVMKIANDEKLLNQYMDLFKKRLLDDKYSTEEEANGVIEMWRGYFELAKHDNEVPRVLKSIDREFEAVKNGTTQVIDNIETDRKIQKEVIDSPAFQKYLDSLVKPLFDKPDYTAEEVMEDAIYNHGTTDDYETGAYMTLDGQLLDFNSGGYRDDHRTISALGVDMNEFMNYGAIRMQPETPGFEMNVEPTNEQYSRLYDYIDYLKETRTDDISIDIDKGNTYDSATYNINTPTSKIISDLKEYWRTGSFPKQSQFAEFRYSLSKENDIAPVKDSNLTYGEDVRIEQAIAPIQDEIATLTETINKLAEQIAPVQETPVQDASETTVTEEIAPVGNQPMLPADNPQRGDGDIKQRKWVETSTESDVVNRQILPDDLDEKQIYYQVKTNAKTLETANNKLSTLGYEDAVTYFNNQLMNKRASVEDIALGERLIQEAIKKGDKVTASELIQNVAILGTELGQKVQALSIIKRMTPEGQLRMLDKTIRRAKAKEDIVFKDVELTQEMKNKILEVYNEDGSYDQDELNRVIEEIKQELANQMPTTGMEKVNAWRYLSMLGNPKTHIRNLVSNVAMKGTLAVKNAMARTIESVVPVKNRTKTWKKSSDVVNKFADDVTLEMKDIINGDSKYNEEADIKAKRDTFKNKVLNGVYNFNSNLLEAEDWWFSKSAFKNSFREYLTANGIETEQDIESNPEIVEKAKNYALEQSQIATFRQYSWLANKIRDIESKNVATQVAVGSVIPFKKTPINIAKAGLSYSPLGFAKTLTYDIAQVKQGKMEASTLIDHLAQNTTGTALTLIGYMLASAGFLNGGGEDDKEGKYDYQLGEQAYSITIDGHTYSLSWLSPVAMPLFVGANAYEQLVEGKELDGNVIVETLAQTLDPLSEMSFLSGLDQVLSSYDSGMEKFAGIFESMGQNYITQFIPTLSSQVASTFDDTKRVTKASGDSGFKFGEETYNKIAYKIPGLRNTLEPSTDIWGNEVKQNENVVGRAFDNFLAPYSRKGIITSDVDYELKDLYAETGENGLLPNIPNNYVNYKNEKYKMSAEEYTGFKQTYGQTAYDLLEDLFETTTYQNADIEDRVDMVEKVYDYARDTAKKEYLEGKDVEYTNATKDKQEYYKENSIKEAIKNDVSIDEMNYAIKNPENYAVISQIDSYENYVGYKDAISDIKEQYKSTDGMTSKQKTALSKQRKRAVQDYIESLNLGVPQKIMLQKMAGGYSVSSYKNYMFGYIESLPLTAEEKRTIHNELFD